MAGAFLVDIKTSGHYAGFSDLVSGMLKGLQLSLQHTLSIGFDFSRETIVDFPLAVSKTVGKIFQLVGAQVKFVFEHPVEEAIGAIACDVVSLPLNQAFFEGTRDDLVPRAKAKAA
jgi:hypothetical protein